MGRVRNVHKTLVGKPERKRPPVRPRRRRKYNITINLRELRWKVVELMHLVQDTDQ
jgi:hypothetical protein